MSTINDRFILIAELREKARVIWGTGGDDSEEIESLLLEAAEVLAQCGCDRCGPDHKTWVFPVQQPDPKNYR